MPLWSISYQAFYYGAPSSHDAITNWRKIRGENTVDGRDFTPHQIHYLELPDERIEAIFQQVDAYRHDTNQSEERSNVISQRQKEVFSWNDEYEKRQIQKRSLDKLRENGIRVEFTEIPTFASSSDGCPLSDAIKNDKIVVINGLKPPVKISLIAHDVFDHFWIFDQLDKNGLLERYQDFLQSVGNPQATDIYKREGELIASVSYEWRASHVHERQYKPIIPFHYLQQILKKSVHPTTNQEGALKILETTDSNSQFAEQLESIYSGVLLELLEQRRKYGMIKTLDPNFEVDGVLPLTNPEYLAFVVEISNFFNQHEDEAKSTLQTIDFMTEDYLARLKSGSIDPLVVMPDDLAANDKTFVYLPQKIKSFIIYNPFYTAARELECN